MGKLQDFLMKDTYNPIVEKEVKVSGLPYPFIIKSITEDENKEIRKACMKYVYDKETHTRQMELDPDAYNAKLIVACCVDPNLKDAELQKKYGVIGAENLLTKILTAGQYAELLFAVQEINGFNKSLDELREEAKNS